MSSLSAFTSGQGRGDGANDSFSSYMDVVDYNDETAVAAPTGGASNSTLGGELGVSGRTSSRFDLFARQPSSGQGDVGISFGRGAVFPGLSSATPLPPRPPHSFPPPSIPRRSNLLRGSGASNNGSFLLQARSGTSAQEGVGVSVGSVTSTGRRGSAAAGGAGRGVPRTPWTPAAASVTTSYPGGRTGHGDSTFMANSQCYVALVEGRGSARGEVGLASICLTDPTLVLCQITDSATYNRTLAKLCLFSPVEILIPMSSAADPANASKLYEEMEKCCAHSVVQQVHRKYFNEAKGLQVIRHLCAPEYSSVEVHLQHKYYSLAAANALMKYVEHVQNVFYAPKSLRMVFQASADSVLIDADTARHVELLDSSLGPKSNSRSLFGVFNRCHTPGGTRQLRANLFQPPTRLALIEDRLDSVDELTAKPGVFHSLQALVSRFCDIDRLLSLCVVVPRQETLFTYEQRLNNVIGLRQALELVEPLRTALGCAESPALAAMHSVLEDRSYTVVFDKISEVLSENAKLQKGSAGMKLQRCFAVKAGVNGLLDVARRAYCEIVDDIEEMVSTLSEEHGVPMRVAFNAARGYHVQIVQAGSGRGRGRAMGAGGPRLGLRDLPRTFLQAQQSKGGSITFTTEEIIKADLRGREALREISVMSNTVVQALLVAVRERIGCLYKLSETVSALDMTLSVAEVSMRSGYVRPRFGPHTVVRAARHPILDADSGSSCAAGGGAVPNDVEATCENSFSVLTGANMSGKSTYLKMVVLLQVMAQVGCRVPAELATFRLADNIFSRMGTGDSLECNASTFELEMKEMAYILGGMSDEGNDRDGGETSSSLVVMDELGRGTSTTEGAAICWAIAEQLIGHNGRAFCFLATHFSLITNMEKIYPTVANYHFVTEDKTHPESGECVGLVHTHKLAKGAAAAAAEGEERQNRRAASHYGIQLARSTSLPKEVVDRAEVLAEEHGERQAFVAEPTGECAQRVNYVRLFNRLRLIARQEEEGARGGGHDDDLARHLRELRSQFLEEE